MKQFTAILLLLVYTCSGSTFQELRKAPVLVQHYLEHKEVNEQISFAQFVVIHYLSGNEKDADYTRDQQLPFRSPDYLNTAASAVFTPSLFPELTFVAPLPKPTDYVVHDILFSFFRLPNAIWQPPQTC